ncbi:MAG: DUF2442 domain-containing protein [bacterium]
MRRIEQLKVVEYRKLALKFDDGTQGILHINEEFKNVAEPLQDPLAFATARIIDDGYGIGFDDCDYDICAQYAYDNILQAEKTFA